MAGARAASWLAARLGTSGLGERLREARVPAWSIPHYLVAVAVWLFMLEVASGILLMLFYRPHPDAAYDSIVLILGLPHGALIRSVHGWTGQFFVLAVGSQVAAVLLTRRFTPPREVVWWASLALLLLGTGLALTGAVLPWTRHAQLQALVSSELLGRTPLIGEFLVRLVRGGSQVTDWTLHHAFGFHVGVLPASTFLVGALYLVLLIRTPDPKRTTRSGSAIPLFPDFGVRVAAVCVGLLAAVLALAVFAPVGLGVRGDLPNAGAPMARPPWYLLFLHQLLAMAPARLLGMDSPTFITGGVILVGSVLVGLPLIDRRGSRATLVVGLVALALWALLTVYALA